MSTYLLTWKPRHLPSEDLNYVVAKLAAGNFLEDDWSCGNNSSIQPGDRVFLLRQGRDHPGIMGSGWITKGSFQAPSWDKSKRRRGCLAWFVELEWDAMVLAENVLSRAELLRGILPGRLLKVACSGVIISDEFANNLEKNWAAHRKTCLAVAPFVFGSLRAWEGEPIEHRTYRHKRDLRLKRAVLDASLGVCEVCGIDYSKMLNGKGVHVLQVHHKKQLSQQDAPRLNCVSDLAVVCANCHALLHIDKTKALSVNELKLMLKASIR